MDEGRLEEWVCLYVPTFACWDLVEYLCAVRPEAVSLEELARQVGRAPGDLRPAVAHLVGCGVLQQEADGGDARYRFAPTPAVQAELDQLVALLEDHALRLEVVTQILHLTEKAARRTSGFFSRLRRRGTQPAASKGTPAGRRGEPGDGSAGDVG